MSALKIRSELHELIDQVDERFLRAVYLMVSTYQGKDPIIGYDLDGRPRTASELTDILENEVALARRGEYITIEAFQKESAQWGKPTK
ncbi:MAG: hypothetical protein KDC34_08445 [Saprospiraceae bacterium]|nr:hypothetical protein [Saprospiraceae bacterium]